MTNYDPTIFYPTSQQLVILVGYPGSGKSTFATKYLSNYTVLSQDIFNSEGVKQSMTISKFTAQLRLLLSSGQSVAIDRTNLSEKDRQQWIDIAKSINPNIIIKIIWFETDLETSYNMNLQRPQKERVPKIAYYAMRKTYTVPYSKDSIIVINAASFENHLISKLMELGKYGLELVMDLSQKGNKIRDEFVTKVRNIIPSHVITNINVRKDLLNKAISNLIGME